MDKHLSPHTASTIEAYFGPTQRHPGRQKARLFTAQLGLQTQTQTQTQVQTTLARYTCVQAGGELLARPGVFSAEKLDGGSRLLLQQLENLAPVERVLDLACGNGVLGLAAMRQGLTESVIFADESALALASARQNVQSLYPDCGNRVSFLHSDGLHTYRGPPVQLILCNPPFHQGASVDEGAGKHLLKQCSTHLAPEGRLCLVANRHLKYQGLLARQFASVQQLAQNRKFVVLLCRKR